MQDERIQGFRLSAQQEHLWAVLPSEDVARREARCEVRIEGPLDPDALAAAVRGVVASHEILRTRFRFFPGVRFPLQVVADASSGDASPILLEELDLRHLGEAEASAAIERARAALAEPRDLADGPPLRLALLRLAPEERLLLLGLPALCCDEAGLEILVRDLGRVCGGAGLEPVQYVDVSEWHHDLLAGDEGALGREHWRDHRLPSVFAASLPGETQAEGTGGSVAALRLEIAAETAARLTGLAARLGAEPRALLLAAWAALLGRLVDGEETVLGVACGGRRYDELKDVVGLLARHLPVRLPALAGLTFEDLAVRLGEQLEEAESWQEAFSWQDAAGTETGADPFLPFCFSCEPEPELLPAGPAAFRIVDRKSFFDRFLVKLSLLHGAAAVRGELLYDAGRLGEAEAARLVERFLALLESALEEPRRPVESLALLGARERRHVLVELNDTAVPLRQVRCIHHLFAEQAARRPQHTAVRWGDRSLTYGELDAKSSELAASLRGLGVGPDTIVGLYVERSLEMVVGILGVLAAGGAYLPLDPVYPAERLGFMIEDSGVRVLLTQSRLLDGLPPHRATVVCLDGAQHAPAEGAPGSRSGDPDSGHLAYVIYTSGSTGRPKGVGVSHANLVHSTQARLAFYERPVESFLLLSSFAFDSSVAGIFWSLCQGGTLVLPDGGPQLDPEHVSALMARQRITHVLALPSLYGLLLAQAGPEPLTSLQTAIVAGEACPAELVERHHAHCPGALLCNEYGPTEGTVWSSAAVLPRGLAAGRVSIGRPIANTRIYLLDREAEPVPAGLAGELYVGGPGLARGYLGRPDLTAERFVPDPFGTVPGQRLYRTGDLARHLADGEIEFLGRIDHQVKIRGFRIELGEVEAALLRHPEIAEAVVVAREDEPGDKRLVAYFVTRGSAAPDLAGLRDFLRAGLPEHMVPAAFVPLDELPRTPNGKVDRRNLPAPGESRLRGRAELIAPRTPVEEVVAGIWGDLLGLDAVGADDHFFDLGGHSLLATRVVSRLREAFRVELTLPDLFAAPRVAEMAARIEQALRAEDRIVEPPLVRADRSADLPLSFAQQRLWFLDQLEPGATVYNVPMAVRISGPLAVEALRRSLEEIVRRHEVLRTTFAAVDGRPRQVIAREPELSFAVTDLRQMPEGEREERARHLASQELGRPFDLARGPLLRVALLELGDEDRVLLVTVHHIVSDLWSIGIFIRELDVLYEAFSRDQPSPLPELPIQYADFAGWQRGWLQGEVLERQLEYWRGQLAGAPPALDLPTDRTPATVRTYRAGKLPFRVPPETATALRQMGRGANATLFMTLLGLYQVLLGRYSGQRDVCIGVPIAGRTRVEIEPLIGFFVNTLVLRCDQAGDPTFRDFLARVRQASLGAYTHQDLPFEILVEDLQPERELSRSPLFQVLFALQNAEVGALKLGGLRIDPLRLEEAAGTPFDLSLAMRELPDGLAGSLEYSAELFDEETVRRLAGHFHNLVRAALTEPDRRLSELSLLAPGELQQILVEWNQTATGHDRERTLQQLFEAQAAATPEALALSFHDRRLTYRELNGRANRLAHHLRSAGVGPEVRVGILLERSPELVIALLGVLKAGGAYVPLDPAYPDERLDFMLTDSGAPVLISQPDLVPPLERPGVRRILLGPDLAGFPENRELDPEPRALPQNLALVIYTSGSTGVPKGVAIQHRSVAALLGWAGDVFPPADLAAVLASTSVCFDLSVFELFLPLCRGGRVVLVESVLHLSEDPAASEVTLINTVPSAMAQLLELETRLPSVRTVNLAGEPLRGALVDRIYASTPARRVLNLYGPSEDTTYSTCAVVPPGCAVPSIGRPGGDTCAYLLDADLRPVPVGVSGELCLAGAGLARGYLDRPDLTAERFVPDPFGSVAGGRLYRTGDLARYQPDGQIRFLRRIDHQVKIRGFRIELGEIEAALHRHPTVEEAVVVVREDRPGDRRLVAYLVPAGGATPDSGELRMFLGRTLPGSMIPSELMVLAALPRTPNGKLDRKALPAPGAARAGRGADEAPPRTPVEERIAEIWSEVLGVERIGIHESFFDLGGHSLLATQVVARLRRSFDVEIPLRSLFERPTVAQLAELVEASRPADAAMDKIAAMLAKIEKLSSEEARALLEQQGLRSE